MKKSLVVWILGCLTFLAGLHTFDAVLCFASSNNAGSLLELYPFSDEISQVAENVGIVAYFWLSLASTFAFMGVTCCFAFYDPVLSYVKRVVSETKIDDVQTDARLDSELTALSMINESLTNQGTLLNTVKGELDFVKDGITAIKIDAARLRSKMQGLETDLARLRKCPACGKNVVPEFRFCPHCGEKLSLYVLVRQVPKQDSQLVKTISN